MGLAAFLDEAATALRSATGKSIEVGRVTLDVSISFDRRRPVRKRAGNGPARWHGDHGMAAIFGRVADLPDVGGRCYRGAATRMSVRIDDHAASFSNAGSGSGRVGSSLIRLGATRGVRSAAPAAATTATSAPAAASRKKWLPVATTTSSTNGG